MSVFVTYKVPDYMTIDYIREHRDEVDWPRLSDHYKFTVDELREFKDYIDWNCYYVYHYHHNETLEQALEFKDRSNEWVMVYHFKEATEELIRKWVWEIVTGEHTWRWLFKFQRKNISVEFKKEYAEQIDWDVVDEF